jgi:pimeloyl-ACP methyl ester carboxylesterase
MVASGPGPRRAFPADCAAVAADDFARTSTTDGQTFVYRDQGTGPLVLLVHGFPDTPHSWTGIAGALAAAGYRTVTPWLRGYHPDTVVAGRSYGAVAIGEDALRLLDALGEESAVIVGHDWGASVAYAAASLAPARVRAVVGIGVPHPSTLKPSPKLAWGVRHFLALKLPWAERTVTRRGYAYVDQLYARWAPNWTGPARDEAVRSVKACFETPSNVTGAVAYYRALSPRIPKAVAAPPKVPGFVVGGTADIIPAEVFRHAAEVLDDPHATLVVDGAGHWPHREGEDEFVAALVAFLSSL